MKMTLHIEGMTCKHCVQHVEEALKAVPGVTSAKVNLKSETAVVEHTDAVTLPMLKTAVEEAGYGIGTNG